MGPRLGIVELAYPRVSVLTEKLLEVHEQLLHVDAVVRVHVPERILRHHILGAPSQLTRDNLTVDIVGDAPGTLNHGRTYIK